jgi:penicillin-binding protein 2
VARPIEQRLPVQGKNIVTSLDIELQQAAETAMAERIGAAVALDVRTGEVLVLVSKPDYDLNTFVPRISTKTFQAIEASGGWLNRAIQGQYPPGSTFKVITAIAGVRSGAVEPGVSKSLCPGYYMVGNKRFVCHLHSGHGERDVVTAIRDSCNVFFYKYGLEAGPELIAAEAKRFGYNHPTGIELPSEFKYPRVADPEWRRAHWKSANLPDGIWRPGDTANISIGQGDTLITPLQAACFVASLARGETETKPTLLHDPNRRPQRTAPIGLTPTEYKAIIDGMNQSYRLGTGKLARVDGLDGAAKTGTAQKGRIELAWTIAFAPLENPQIAIAVVLEGAVDVNFGGGANAAPVAKAILEAWKAKRERPPEEKIDFRMR